MVTWYCSFVIFQKSISSVGHMNSSVSIFNSFLHCFEKNTNPRCLAYISPAHHHTTSTHPTHTLCIAAKLLSPQTYYPIRQITIFHQNSAVCPLPANRTVKPHTPIYSAFLGIETPYSTCLGCSTKNILTPLLYKGMVERTFLLKIWGIKPVTSLICLIVCIGKFTAIKISAFIFANWKFQVLILHIIFYCNICTVNCK